MNGSRLESILQKDAKCRAMFLGVFACDRLPKTIDKSKPTLLCVILIHTTNLVDTGLYCTLKIPPMANTLTLLVNLLSRLSERFYINIARVGFTLIEIYKALSVDFARTIVYSIAFIDVETKLLMPLQICLLMTLVLMII